MSQMPANFGSFPTTRLDHASPCVVPKLVAEHHLSADDLIWPVFVHEGSTTVPVPSMPGVPITPSRSWWRKFNERVIWEFLPSPFFPQRIQARKRRAGKKPLMRKIWFAARCEPLRKR